MKYTEVSEGYITHHNVNSDGSDLTHLIEGENVLNEKTCEICQKERDDLKNNRIRNYTYESNND